MTKSREAKLCFGKRHVKHCNGNVNGGKFFAK